MKKLSVLVGSLMLLLVMASVAFAHAEIASCTPAINGTVEAAPDKVVCKTSESMDPKGSSLAVFDEMGMQVDKGDSAVDLNDPDRVTIAVSLDTAMMEHGVYTVKWTTLSQADGDEAKGEFKFTVGHAMQMDMTPAASETDTTMHPNGDHSIGVATLNGKEVTLKLLTPQDDAEVETGMVKVETSLDGATLGEADSHLHFYLDDNLALMGKGAQTSAEIEIQEPGAHEIKVTYSDADHMDLIQVHVHVMAKAAADAQATPSAEATTAPTSAPAAEPTAAPTMEPTPVPATLPATGGDANATLFAFVALLGALVLGGGVLAAVRARR